MEKHSTQEDSSVHSDDDNAAVNNKKCGPGKIDFTPLKFTDNTLSWLKNATPINKTLPLGFHNHDKCIEYCHVGMPELIGSSRLYSVNSSDDDDDDDYPFPPRPEPCWEKVKALLPPSARPVSPVRMPGLTNDDLNLSIIWHLKRGAKKTITTSPEETTATTTEDSQPTTAAANLSLVKITTEEEKLKAETSAAPEK